MKKIKIISFVIIIITLFIIIFKDKFSFNYSNGNLKDSKTFKEYLSKDKLVVINNWASWCKPCIEEIPFLNELKEKYEKDVFFLSFSHDKDTIKTIKALKEYNFKWNEITIFDYNFKKVIKSSYQNSFGIININELPYTYFIKNGKVVFIKNGVLDKNETISVIEKSINK